MHHGTTDVRGFHEAKAQRQTGKMLGQHLIFSAFIQRGIGHTQGFHGQKHGLVMQDPVMLEIVQQS